MALKLGPTGLGSGIDKDRQDFTIYSSGWALGRIYEQRGGPDSMRWFWSLYGVFGKPADMRTDGHAATLSQPDDDDQLLQDYAVPGVSALVQ